jgi:hypothetical protein
VSISDALSAERPELSGRASTGLTTDDTRLAQPSKRSVSWASRQGTLFAGDKKDQIMGFKVYSTMSCINRFVRTNRLEMLDRNATEQILANFSYSAALPN